MPSSTSHSKRRVPRLALGLLAVAVGAWALSALYMVRLNPELRFISAMVQTNRAWTASMDAAHSNKVVVYGGSSCATSIDPERLLEQHHLPSVNFGFAAGIGAPILTRAALSVTRPGDTLVIALEPDLLHESGPPPALGVQFAMLAGRLDWLREFPGQPHVSPARVPVDLRPGGRHAFTLLVKLITGKKLYRYDLDELHPGGWQEIRSRFPMTAVEPPSGMSPQGKALLVALREWGRTNRVQVLYSQPRGYVEPAQEARFRSLNARWLLSVAEVLPVLKDRALGTDSDADHFADMNWHPNRVGAGQRTDELARALKAREFWTAEELRAEAGRPQGEQPVSDR